MENSISSRSITHLQIHDMEKVFFFFLQKCYERRIVCFLSNLQMKLAFQTTHAILKLTSLLFPRRHLRLTLKFDCTTQFRSSKS